MRSLVWLVLYEDIIRDTNCGCEIGHEFSKVIGRRVKGLDILSLIYTKFDLSKEERSLSYFFTDYEKEYRC